MQLELGKKVVSSDGEKVGEIDRLVIDPETREITEMIVHKGFFLAEDRVVPLATVRSVDDDGTVHLSASSEAVEDLPLFVERAYYVPSAEEFSALSYYGGAAGIAPGMGSPILWGAPPPGEPLMSTAIEQDTAAEVQATPEDAGITIDKGTVVLDSSGEHVGHVEDVQYDEHGRLTGIVVKEGIIRRHEYHIPAQHIDQLHDSELRLNVLEAELSRQ